jgi:hypothetical protein
MGVGTGVGAGVGGGVGGAGVGGRVRTGVEPGMRRVVEFPKMVVGRGSASAASRLDAPFLVVITANAPADRVSAARVSDMAIKMRGTAASPLFAFR